jgi:hypothetical protein
MSPRPRRVLFGCLALLVAAGCGEERSTKTPLFEAQPGAFTFAKLEIGQSEVRRVQVLNRGSGALVIQNPSIEDGSTTGSEFSLFVEVDGELQPAPARMELPGNSDDTITLAVRYVPADEDATVDSGAVLLQTNDPDAREVRIPIGSGGQGAEIRVSPRTIDFGEVEAGATGKRDLVITNIGLVELVITRFAVSGSQDFGASKDDQALLGDLAEPIVVPPGETTTIQATYAPPTLGPDSGELQIFSNDVASPVTTIELNANGAAPCLNVIPESLDFGAGLLVESVNVETPNRLPLTLESCGTTPLRVDRLELVGGDGVFRPLELPDVAEGEPLFLLPAASEDTFPTQQVQIGFWPTDLRAYGGQLLVHSNASREPFPVDLFGRGVDNACPIPAVTTDRYDVQPLDIVTLDGTPSADPGGRVEDYIWTVVSRPDGSVSQPVERFADPRRPADGGDPDDEATPQAFFFVDLAGRYELELQVRDNLGQLSCDPNAVARVIIEAVPDKDLHIQLVWSTPDDPDETDMIGTDVDLHLRHERGRDGWGNDAGIWDCYFRQKSPDWGIEGEVADNPTLDIDDTNGAGPENINLSDPEVGVTYDVGAVYFRAESTFGLPDADRRKEHASYVTTRIFVRGELLYEAVDRELTTVQQLWWVASVEWCEDFARCPVVDPVDQVFSEADWAMP